MNKVVTLHMPAADLPDKIRGEIASDHQVEITIRDLGAADEHLFTQGTGTFSRFFHLSYPHFKSTDDVVKHVRAIRDGDEEDVT